MRKFLMALVLGSVPLLARGSTVIGNPNSGVVLVDGDDVYVHSIVAYPCSGGSQTVPIDVTLAELESEPFELDEDEYCDVVVRVQWRSTSSLESVAVGGFDVLDIDATGAAFTIDLDPSAETASIN